MQVVSPIQRPLIRPPQAFIEPGGIPTEFGGSLPLGEAAEQKQLKAHVASRT